MGAAGSVDQGFRFEGEVGLRDFGFDVQGLKSRVY